MSDEMVILLYASLLFLLTGKRALVPVSMMHGINHTCLDSLYMHFEAGVSPATLLESLHVMRIRANLFTDIIAISYVDFLFAVTICALDHSAWLLLPQYSTNELEEWKNYLSKRNSIKLLWPAQKVLVQAGALTGKDLVVPLPTGVGKTKSMEILLQSKFLEQGACIAVIIAPLRALCNEITSDLSSALADVAIVNQFTDTTQEDFDLSLALNTKCVYVCTPEKFSYIIRHDPEFLTAIQLFLFDEAHLFDDSSRGAQYELLVSEIARNRSGSTQMILFSAVLSNSEQISEWLFDDKKATIDYSLVKSTEKSIGFISSNQTIHYYEKDDMSEESFLFLKV